MAETKQEEPIRYKFYGKEYEYDSLKRDLDEGLNDYIYGLKRGKKDYDSFIEAYNNMMSGIKSGDITFNSDEGRFIDTKYGYHNLTGDKNKDYYGLVASYIHSKMGQGSPYTKPKDPNEVDYTSGILENDFIKDLFGSANPNETQWKAFWDRDSVDDKGVRGLDKRYAYVYDILNNMSKTHTTKYSNYSEQDQKKNNEQLKAILELFTNNKKTELSPDEYAEWLKLFPNIDPYKLFSTSRQYTTSDTQKTQAQQLEELWDEFITQNNYTPGTYTDTIFGKQGGFKNSDDLGLTSDYVTAINNYLGNPSIYPSISDLGKLLTEFVSGSKKGFEATSGNNKYTIPAGTMIHAILKYLQNNNELANPIDGYYYIPGSWEQGKNTGLVWNPTTGTLIQRDQFNIPYSYNQILQNFNTWLTNRTEGIGSRRPYVPYDQYITSNKQGGVIKADTGVKLAEGANWFDDVFSGENGNLNYILAQLAKYGDDYATWLNNQQDAHYNLYKNAGDYENIAYKSNKVGKYQEDYISGYNGEFGENNKSGYNQYGITNSYNKNRFDFYGDTIRQEKDRGEFGWKKDNLYSAITDWRRLLGRVSKDKEGNFTLDDFTPEQLTEIQSKFRELGYEFKLDPKTNYYKLYWDPKSDKIEISDDSQNIATPELDSNVEYNTEQEEKPNQDPTKVTPTKGDQSTAGFKEFLSNVGKSLDKIAPDLLDTTRLFLSLNANNKIAKTLRQKPTLLNTYELQSPVTGAFGEMKLKNNMAAEIRRTAAEPKTSDASLYQATQLEGNRLANEQIQQGFIDDDKEIRRTQLEALKRHEDNKARRSDIANKNRVSLNETRNINNQVEAARLQKNWSSWDNYLKGIQDKYLKKTQEREALYQNAMQDIITNNYSSAVAKLQEKFRQAHAGDSNYQLSTDPKFIDAMQKYRTRLKYEIYNSTLNNSSDPWKESVPEEYDKILNSISFNKQGGKLSLTTQFLINKVINK